MIQQLPSPPAEFVDREPLLAWMSEMFATARLAGRTANVALYGPAGVGARSVVHEFFAREREWCADGALRVPLGDAVSGGDALVAEALGDALAHLGVPRGDLPASVEALKNLLRTKTHDLRLLVVLEGVTNRAQVEHFMLNSPGSAVVAISRSEIRTLRVLGFEIRRVERLDTRFGVELFERMLGPGWFSEARVAPESVARVCGGYPLAIRATAAQIASTPEWDVANLIRDLAGRGLGALDPESQEFVRDSFDRAYQRLPDDQARAYRLVVGLYPGASVFTDAASVLLNQPEDEARALLAALTAAQLLTRVGADRFEFHDVAHWHARDRAEADEPFPRQVAAVERVVRWYLAQTIRRDRALSDRPRLGAGYLVAEPPDVARGPALDWLEERRGNLLAAVALAERFQLPDVVWQLCEALWGVYHLHGHHEEWITTHRAGVEAAVQLGDPRVRMRMTSQLGAALIEVADLRQAAEAFAESHRCAVESHDAVGAQSALEWLGKTARADNQYAAALDYFDASWKIAESDVPEHLRQRMFALLWLQRARTYVLTEDHDAARNAAEHAVNYFTGTTERDNLAKSLLVLAKAGAQLGDPTAAHNARRSAELFRQDKSARREVEALEIVETLAPESTNDIARLHHLREELRGPETGTT